MDHFGRLADDLVDRLELIEDDDALRADGLTVMRYLQKAIDAACMADRTRRLRREERAPSAAQAAAEMALPPSAKAA